MPFDFGDVVLVPFPFTSQRASKKRPAVVVSNRTYSADRPDLIVMAVTSQLRPNPGWAMDGSTISRTRGS
jgi:mRNA interferase MazF